MRRHVTMLPVMILLAAPLRAQQPEGWRIVLDSTAAVSLTQAVAPGHYRFATMPPGFHVTMGPGALVYAPDNQASGRFSVEATMYLFPGTSNEGYGLFLGGTNLDKGEPAYTAFMLKRSGEAGVLRWDGERTTIYVPWTRPDSVKLQTGTAVAGNTLLIAADADSVRFVVNGRAVGAIPRGLAPMEGLFGYRVGAGLNVHAATLDYTRHIAPGRPARGG